MEQRTNAVIAKAATDFAQLRAERVIDDNLYFKCLVSLAYEYAENQENEQCARLLFQCPPDYFSQVLPRQVQEDKLYRDCVIRLTYNLIRAGYIEFAKDPLELIQPTAKA